MSAVALARSRAPDPRRAAGPALALAALAALAAAGDDPAAEAQHELERGLEHVAAGRYERARDAYQRVLRRWPDSPAARQARARLDPNGLLGWADLVRHGPAEERIDVVVLGDGYTFEQQNAFDDVAADLPRTLERSPVFGEYFAAFNFLRGNAVSAEAGLDGYGREASTALGGRTIEQTNAAHVAVDPYRARALAARVPGGEGLAIAVVKRGGAAGTAAPGVATIGGSHFQTLLHEWGHAFADLGDEYAVDRGFERHLPAPRVNVALTDDPARVPWAHWIAAGASGIGTYEGAAGRVQGVWRPQASNCVMNEGGLFFCAPCREAIVLAIYDRFDPILALAPREAALDDAGELALERPVVLQASVFAPASHDLEAAWWVLPEDRAPAPAQETRPRSERGPLAALDLEPVQGWQRARGGRSELRLDPRALAPGRWRLVLRVRDTTRLPEEELPWVLKDERDLLRSERSLVLRVP